ncbi:MAG: hypothetical protein HXY24_10865 [Rubrivivax sp.]|nr:hypothetical protein [Rubrivivax sp.]
MANANNPHGLLPLYSLAGGALLVEEFDKLSTYGTALYPGDAVACTADGRVLEVPATPGTTRISGVNLNWGAASKATKHLVVVDPVYVFEAQADDALAAADMGLNANLVYGAGSATKLTSGHQIDASTVAVTATLDVKLLKKLAIPGNDWGAYVRIEILINKHRMTGDTAGV